MMTPWKTLNVKLVDDAKFARFAVLANFGGALVVLVLGSRYVGQVATTPIEMLLGVTILLLVCIGLIILGLLQQLIADVNKLKNEMARVRK